MLWLKTIILKAGSWFRFIRRDHSHELNDLQNKAQRNLARLQKVLKIACQLQDNLDAGQSESEALRSQLEQTRKELLALSDVKNKFLANVSHELRTPMAAIQECVNLISDGIAGPVTPRQLSFLEIAQRNVERLASVLDNLLDLSRLETGGLRVNLARVGLDEMVSEAVNTVQPKAQKKKVEIQITAKWNLPPVLVDRQRVIQVLCDLLDNAVKFSRAGGKVTVSARHLADTKQLEICVEDTGQGIPAKEAAKLFGHWYEFREKQNYTVPGARLGLAICKEVITQLGGSIWVESAKGASSKFYFTLRCYSDEELLKAHFKSSVQIAMGKKSPLMYLAIHVDNYPTLRERYGPQAMERTLAEMGKVVSACFRADDRIAVDFAAGRVHILVVAGDSRIKHRITKLEDILRERAFFAGDELLQMDFVYGMTRFPDDGEDLESLKGKLDRQVRAGGLAIVDLPLDGAA